jgi:diguanylate cyclase (GGDEF)-like protein
MTGTATGVEPITAAPIWSGRRGQVAPKLCGVLYAVAALTLAGLASSATLAVQAGAVVGVPELLAAALAFTVSQLTSVKLRFGSEVLPLAWGEVGVVAALCLAPVGWAPVAAGVGVLLAHGRLLVGTDAARRTRVCYRMAVVALGAMMAAVVATVHLGATGTPVLTAVAAPVPVHLDRPESFLPLLLAAAAYSVTTLGLGVLWTCRAGRREVGATCVAAVRGKGLLLPGIMAVAVAVAAITAVDRWWLAALAPVLWLLHRGYAHHERAARERLTWVALADAARSLHHIDEEQVAAAALGGAVQIFGPDEAEIVLHHPSGRRRGYQARAGRGEPVEISANTGRPAAWGDGAPVVSARQVVLRRLAVGRVELGELRLRFRRPVTLGAAEQHAFATFADAVAAALHDASTHRRLQVMTARSAYEAVHDPLTGLSNRSTMIARGNAVLCRVAPAREAALVLVDIDGLRAVNDTLGHAAGDELLQLVARRLAAGRGDDELVGRLGGDEFGLLLAGGAMNAPGLGALAYPFDRARSALAAVSAPAQIAGVTIAVEACAGVAVTVAGGCDMAELLRRAEVALHQAKREGTRVARYDGASGVIRADRLALLADLRDALATTEQLAIDLQPIVDLATGRVTGAEALARWQHPRRGRLLPADFVRAIEHSELAGGFTAHILDLALGVSADWAAQGTALPIAVNLCPRCTVIRDLPERVAGRLAAYGVPPERLTLEITETVVAAAENVAADVIGEFRSLGVGICVDHFGTGSASLQFLTRFGVDAVKIDASFIAAMSHSPEAAAIVRTTVDLARDLDLRVIATGVERADQRAALLDLGVVAGQGYLFHPPRPVDDTAAILRAQSIAA